MKSISLPARPILLLPLFILAALAVGSIFRHPSVIDDPFITYRYARNLVQGAGFVYNPGVHVLSTTTPLYALVLAVFGFVVPDIPLLGFWFSVLGLGTSAWALYLIGSNLRMPLAGLIAGLLMLVAPSLIQTLGLETGIYLGLALSAFALYLSRRFTAAFALLALLTLTRNDGILLAGILALHFLWRQFQPLPRSRREFSLLFRTTWLPLAVFAAVLLPWLAFAWAWFGTPFPFTLTAKIAQTESGLWQSFAAGSIQWTGEWARQNWPFAVSAIVGLVLCLFSRSQGLVLVAWAVLHFVGYSLLGVAFYPWYVAPLLPAAALMAGIGMERAARWLAGRLHFRPTTPVTLGLALVLLLTMELRDDVDAGFSTLSGKAQVYALAAQWLSENTPPNATIDALEVGLIGYYDDRRTVDFVGLVDPARVPYVRNQQLVEGVRHTSADYVVALPSDTWLNIDPWFSTAYRLAKKIKLDDFSSGKPLVIYRRVDSGQSAAETVNLKASFEKKAELEAVDLFSRTARPGEALPLVLHLSAPAPLRGYKITAQLLDPANEIIAQSDVGFPLRIGTDNTLFLDHQAIPIPGDTPPGKYKLILALYNAEDGERSSIIDPRGNEAGDFVSLGDLVVQR